MVKVHKTFKRKATLNRPWNKVHFHEDSRDAIIVYNITLYANDISDQIKKQQYKHGTDLR